MLLPIAFRQIGGDLSRVSFIGSLSQSKGAAHPVYPSMPGEAFLLDHDKSALELRKQLIKGDPGRENPIFSLDFTQQAWTSRTTEDLIDLSILSDACKGWSEQAKLAEPTLNGNDPVLPQMKAHLASLLTDTKDVNQQLSSLKTYLAHDLVGKARDGETIVRSEITAHLHTLWSEIQAALAP